MSKFFIRLLFLLPPETAHHVTLNILNFIYHIPGFSSIFFRKYKNRNTSTVVAGLTFYNKLGLAAGFDKNAEYMHIMKGLGFGFMEVGTVTPLPQDGNPKPRLFRLKKDKAIINRMGFNNDGLELVAKRLEKFEREDFIIGGNIGKNKVTANEKAVDDYVTCFNRLFDLVDYFTVNVSSPNTPNLRDLQTKSNLLVILNAIQKINRSKSNPKPVFLKIAPDVSEQQLDDIVEAAVTAGIDGIIATNTTVSREGLSLGTKEIENLGAGGLSGKPITEKSQHAIELLRSKCPPEMHLIGAGGIMNVENGKERLDAGADLIQVYTGFIYGGPKLVRSLAKL
ncbi:MAG: quinone-dependent dihydroorotate dehydrogenase [Chitinophagales bacterium]|nr:quinone-dependent dihydroorotate dehydrogenase [Chitinophagales bacterium]